MTQPHLLYVAWGYPPCRGGGVYRALATANAFARSGWRVTVLTADRDTFDRYTGTDPSLESRIDPDITVMRVPFEWPAQDADIRTYSWLRAQLPQAWHRWRGLLDRRSFPERGYGPWRGPLERAARSIHAADPVDLVVSTANPYVTFTAADALAKDGVPYVLDYRDAWTLDVFSGRTLTGRWSRIGRWEQRLLAGAREVWFVNEPIRDWHAARYREVADRMHVVANGWDPDLLRSEDRSPATGRSEAAEIAGVDEPPRPRFGYVGTMTRMVPLTELIDGWELAKRNGSLPTGATLSLAGYLGYFAVPDPQMLATIERGRSFGVSYDGPIAKNDVGAYYADVDVLVLALGAGRYVTSGKVFEYLATGLPIVSVHDPRNAAATVLRGYPLWVPTDATDAAAVAVALGRGWQLARGADPSLAAVALEFAEQFRRDRQFAPRLRALSDISPARQGTSG
ncbi:glycosyltransferase [Occultella glacieicola]|uniref:glycosyltransferase n=1 Tax=Occultella glacieicola TaxID=2518684 RepID=UPI001F41671A|nr:glycosyltransferase [Occultella glacieicola]